MGPREARKRVFDNCLEQVQLADELGFDSVWCVEHHFLEEYSHCSAPEIFLTACAMKTKKMRVGHGIVVCVPEFNHPIKIAERTATMDIISGGRLEVGTGRSATWNELGGFRASPDETKKTWDEFVRCLPKMWTQDRFGYQGRSWSMPVRAILPKPYQKPHPPMWVAVTSPGTEIDAAERGLGALGITFGSLQGAGREGQDLPQDNQELRAGRLVRQRQDQHRRISSSCTRIRRPATRSAGGCSALSISSRRNCWRRVRPIRASRIRLSGCCRLCASRRRDPAMRRVCRRVSRSAIPSAFCAPAKSGNRSASIASTSC